MRSQKSQHYFLIIFFSLLTALAFNNCGKKMVTEETNSSSAGASSASSFSGQQTSEVLVISNFGEIWGYAKDSRNASVILKLRFYVDAAYGSAGSKFAGEVVANQTSSGPHMGHFFTFQLPSQFLNGVRRNLYIYAMSEKPEYMMAPLTFTGYLPKAEVVFNDKIKPFIQANCTSCHTNYWNYTTLYSGPLLNPTPSNGGSATNNVFIRRMAGLTSHNGGRFCQAGLNDGICVEIQKWWNAEFK